MNTEVVLLRIYNISFKIIIIFKYKFFISRYSYLFETEFVREFNLSDRLGVFNIIVDCQVFDFQRLVPIY